MKGNTTRNDFVKFIANNVSMPTYGGTIYAHLHTADPGAGGTSSTNEATYTSYARVATPRDLATFQICDPDGTPNVNGTCFKNLVEITWPECTGVADDEEEFFVTLCTNAGQILYRATLITPIRVNNNDTPRIPPGALIFREG